MAAGGVQVMTVTVDYVIHAFITVDQHWCNDRRQGKKQRRAVMIRLVNHRRYGPQPSPIPSARR